MTQAQLNQIWNDAQQGLPLPSNIAAVKKADGVDEITMGVGGQEHVWQRQNGGDWVQIP